MSTGRAREATFAAERGEECCGGGEPCETGITWELAPAPWPSSERLLADTIEALSTIEDQLLAGLVERLALAVVQGDEKVQAVRSVQSVALEQLHLARRENERLRQRLAEVRNDRAERGGTRSMNFQGRSDQAKDKRNTRAINKNTNANPSTNTNANSKDNTKDKSKARRAPWTCENI